MTETAGTRPSGRGAPQAPGRPSPLPTIAAAAALFFVAFEFLAFELRSGRDPSLSATAASSPQIVRKVLRTKVVTDVTSGAGGSPGGATVSSAPAVTSTPAPAAAPVVTSSS